MVHLGNTLCFAPLGGYLSTKYFYSIIERFILFKSQTLGQQTASNCIALPRALPQALTQQRQLAA